MKNWFSELSQVDVGEHIEKKNGLSYLSWMWAWSELKKRYPLSYATVHETPEGMLIWPDPFGCHVKTSVTIVWFEGSHEDGSPERMEHTVTEYLPVMDFKNKSIKYEDADSMAINKTIQRSLTKCIARLGLGGYIYAGEDIPEESEDVKQKKAKEEQEKAALIASTVKNIDAEIKRITSDMSKEAKVQFANDTILPIIGQVNYKTCKDIQKLNSLHQKLCAA